MRRVVITGLGAITPIGNDVPELWSSIKAGKHGIAPITRFNTDDIEVKVAAEVKNFEPDKYIDRKESRKMDLYTQYAVVAAIQAVEHCGTRFEDLDPYKIGVIVGSGIGGLMTLEEQHSKFVEKGNTRVSPFFIPKMLSNMASGMVSIQFGFKGANFAPVTACATGTNAIGEAYHKIKHGYLDAAVAGGSEGSITKFAVAGFNNMRALSRSIDPDRASIPFDADRDGFVMGDGAGIVVIEELEHAKARNAKIYAEIVGYGTTGDAYDMTSPDSTGEGAAKSMEYAINEASISPDKIDYINAHGTSTPMNDKFETAAIRLALKEHASSVIVSSTKSMTGHLLGAAGAVEAIICSLALYEGVVPGTINYKNPDPCCDLDYVIEGTKKCDIKYALSNSLGFGGHNATLCFKKYE